MITAAKTTRPIEMNLAEINRRLPLVTAIVTDLADHWTQILAARGELERAEAAAKADDATYREQDRMDEVVDELNRLVDRVNGYIAEVEQLGGTVQEYKRGVVTFPIRLQGRMVLASWRVGEEAIAHWHEMHECFSLRKAM